MSIVIVKNPKGFVATLRFDNPKFDRILSSSTHPGIYKAIDRYMDEKDNDSL